VIDEELQKRRMKIGLKNAVAAVHDTVSAHVENFIAAAGIMLGARAGFNEGAPVVGKK
jgi:hypothetical protein